MKKYYYGLMVLLMTLVLVGFAACSDDEPKIADIVGTWQCVEPEMYNGAALLFQFTKEGEFHYVVISMRPNGNPDHFTLHGSYTVKGNTLSMTYDYDDGFDGENEPLTCEFVVQGDRLMFLGGEYPTFIRVEDSVIEPYLNVVPHPC